MPSPSSANWEPLITIGQDGQDGRGKAKALIRYPYYPQHSAVNTRQLTHNSPSRTSHHLVTPHRERRQGESSSQHEYRVQTPEERIRDDVGQFGIKTGYDKRDQVSKLTDKKIDGILTSDSGDLTVSLELDLQDDIEGQIEELVRRSRLGQFAAAKEFFQENFQDYSNNPYLLVLYADLLLQQGDFRGVTCLEGRPIFDLAKKLPDSRELQLLRLNWELVQLSAKSRTLEAVGDTSTLLDDVTHVLSSLEESEGPIGSTEVSS
ncbi:hypothetical protein ANO14919_130670 [Xylariales sp. No.14919]|nr:hypothetical protein ANO14919_130670 [Xylariales sp. No.14919]